MSRNRLIMILLLSWVLLELSLNLPSRSVHESSDVLAETGDYTSTSAGAHITIPTHVYFHLWQQNTCVNFASPTSLDNIVQTNDKLHLDQYWFDIQDANLTISKFFIGYRLILVVSAPSGTTSITKIYVDYWGEPKSVYSTSEMPTWSYDQQTKILTLNVTHSELSAELIVDKRILGDPNDDGFVDIFDIAATSAHWYPGPPIGPLGYDADADLNNDGSIDILDIGIVSAHWTG